MSVSSDYRLIDEIEPVRENAWALAPSAPLLAAMFLPTLWFAIVAAGNSWFLGHAQKRRHVWLAAGYVVAVYVLVAVIVAVVPQPFWKYAALVIRALRLWLGYYLSAEQSWASELFESAGGKVLGLGQSLGVILALMYLMSALHLGGW